MMEEVNPTTTRWNAWIGRTAETVDSLDPWRARALARALGLEAPEPEEGDPLSATWHWVYFLEAHSHAALGEDGHQARGTFLPPVELPSRMWAAGSIAITGGSPLVGTPARRISSIERIEEKTGRSGPLCLVTVRHRMEGLDERQLIVYRTARKPGSRLSGFVPPAGSDRSRDWNADERMLFRYSALTYNAHRIHYDLDWCRNVERYPGLVVHGPLLATALFDLASVIAADAGEEIARFEFRAEAPVFHMEDFRTCGATAEHGADLWIEGADGTGRMRGRAVWRARDG